MDNLWSTACTRCGVGSDHDYCHDCQNMGYDPSLSNYKHDKNMTQQEIQERNKQIALF
jgi:ribosomal protein L37E